MKTAVDASRKRTSELSKAQDQDVNRFNCKDYTFEPSVLEALLISDTEIRANATATLPIVNKPFYQAGERDIGDVEYSEITGKALLGNKLHDDDHLHSLNGTENTATSSASNTTTREKPT